MEAPSPPPLNASLYTLDTFQKHETPCSCKFTKIETRWPEIQCSWEIHNIFQYASLASSTISISNAVMVSGYLESFEPSLTGKKKFMIHVFGLLNIIYGLTIGIYYVDLKSLTHTPWLFLLTFLLFLQVAPPPAWKKIVQQILPYFRPKKRQLVTVMPAQMKQTITVCSLFWFIGIAKGFAAIAHFLTSLSNSLNDKMNQYPFISVYPSIDLINVCADDKSPLPCYKLQGWIETSTALKIINNMYPDYGVAGKVTGNISDDPQRYEKIIVKELYAQTTVASTRVMLGNYSLMDFLAENTEIFLFFDVLLLMIWSIILIFSSNFLLKIHVKMLIVLLLQISPMFLRFFVGESDLINILPLLVIFSFILTAIITWIRVYYRASKSLSKQIVTSVFSFLGFALLPFLVKEVTIRIHSQFYDTYKFLSDFCFRNLDFKTAAFYRTDRVFHKSIYNYLKYYFPPEFFDFIRDSLQLEKRFFYDNFLSVLMGVYEPIILGVACIPFLILVAVDAVILSRSKSLICRVISRLLSIFCFILLPILFYVMKPVTFTGHDWVVPPGLEFVEDFYFTTYNPQVTLGIWEYSRKHFYTKPLNSIDEKVTNFTIDQVSRRFGPMFHGQVHGVATCAFGRTFMHPLLMYEQMKYVANCFRYQYVVLRRYLLYNEIYVLGLIPLGVFALVFIFFSDNDMD